MGDAQQSIVKRVGRRSDPVMFDFRSKCFYCGKPCIEDKKHADRKNFEIFSTINTKIYTSTLEICRGQTILRRQLCQKHWKTTAWN